MSRPKIGHCDGCDRIRPLRRVGVEDGRDVYRCGDCVPWGEGVAMIDHVTLDGGER